MKYSQFYSTFLSKEHLQSSKKKDVYNGGYLFDTIDHFGCFRKASFVDIVCFRLLRRFRAGVAGVTSGGHADGDSAVWPALYATLAFNLFVNKS